MSELWEGVKAIVAKTLVACQPMVAAKLAQASASPTNPNPDPNPDPDPNLNPNPNPNPNLALT